MSESKRIQIHVSEQMHDDLLAIARAQGVPLSKLSWAWMFEKYSEVGTQQMLERIRGTPPGDDQGDDDWEPEEDESRETTKKS